jgi:hypothetical protein
MISDVRLLHVTREEIVAVHDWRKSDLFGPADRAVLAAAPTLFSQLLQSLQVPLEEGSVPWPPDGKRP